MQNSPLNDESLDIYTYGSSPGMSSPPSMLDVYMWTKVPGPSALGQAGVAISVVI